MAQPNQTELGAAVQQLELQPQQPVMQPGTATPSPAPVRPQPQPEIDWSRPAQGAPDTAVMLPQPVLEAYAAGKMTRDQMVELEADVKNGVAAVPEGFSLKRTQAPGFFARIGESITGNERSTDATRGMDDYVYMPELQEASGANLLATLGTLTTTNPGETAQIIQSQFPGVKVRQDEKGNFIMKSAKDGNEYAIQPGFQVSDIPKTLAAGLAFTPAGRATSIVGAGLAGAGTQAALETVQAATGGNFDVQDIAMQGLGGAGGQALAKGAGAMVGRLRGAGGGAAVAGLGDDAGRAAAGAVPEAPIAQAAGTADSMLPAPQRVPTELADTIPAPAQAVTPVAPQAAASAEDITAAGIKAGRSANNAAKREALAAMAAPDKDTLEAARRLDIVDHLQPDHVTTSQAFREYSQAIKSIPGSMTREAEMSGLEKVGQRAVRLIDELGGTRDLSTLDYDIQGQMAGVVSTLEKDADELYSRLRQAIPAKTPAQADGVLEFVKQRADELGGTENLTSMEKRILSKLSPVPEPSPAVAAQPIYSGGINTGKMTKAIKAGAPSKRNPPTYAMMDEIRKEVGAAARMQGPFQDADVGLAKKLYGLLTDDQHTIAMAHGAGELSERAKASVKFRKGLEDDMTALFGKNLDKSLVSVLDSSAKAAAKGDSKQMAKLLRVVPEHMRQNVVVSGIGNMFGNATKNGELNFGTYAKWYEGLQKNKQSMNAIMGILPEESRQRLADLYKVSSGISKATKEYISTGRVQAVKEQFKHADTIANKLYDIGKKAAIRAPLDLAAGAVGLPPGWGVMSAITSALDKGGNEAIKLADNVLATPEFRQAVIDVSIGKPVEQASKRVAATAAFKRFARKVIESDPQKQTTEAQILRALFHQAAAPRGDEPTTQALAAPQQPQVQP